jgi:phage baseplate assembly protein V
MSNEYHLAEAQRRLSQSIGMGIISAVDAVNALVKVITDDDVPESDWMPFVTPRAGAVMVWSLPKVGSTCLVLCPEAELSQAVAMPALSTPAGTATEHFIRFQDGTQIYYNETTQVLDIAAIAKVAVTAPAIALAGAVTISGGLAVTGGATINGVNFMDHGHSGVETGTGFTGPVNA